MVDEIKYKIENPMLLLANSGGNTMPYRVIQMHHHKTNWLESMYNTTQTRLSFENGFDSWMMLNTLQSQNDN